jgi:Putative zinc-finger
MRSPIPSDECARASEWASLRLDEQLSEFEEVLLEAHLARCGECRAFTASITDVTATLRSAALERPAFAFEPPHAARGRTVALRVVSAAAAMAVVGVSSLVSLHILTSQPRAGATPVERKVMGLKERQMNALNGATTRAHTAIPHGLAAAEGGVVGAEPPVAPWIVSERGFAR